MFEQKNVSPKAAAEYLDLKVNTLAQWRLNKSHDLPYVRMGRSIKYRMSDLAAYVERNVVEG